MTDTEMIDEEFNLRLSGGGIQIERRIDRETAAAVMAAIMGIKQVSDNGVSPPVNAVSVQSDTQLSLREFLDSVQAIRKPDQIVAIGYYISHHESQIDFSRDEVRTQFARAREPMPANFPRDFGVALKAGMLAEVHQKTGRFYVTKTGMRSVEQHFKTKQK